LPDIKHRYEDGSQNFNNEVQESVDLAGWRSGNDILFLIMNNAGGWDSHQVICTYEHGTVTYYDSLYFWWTDMPSEDSTHTQ
jgi:hypothetical protein